jgi:hypothetical protein
MAAQSVHSIRRSRQYEMNECQVKEDTLREVVVALAKPMIVKVEDGFVRLYRPEGVRVRTLCHGALAAEIIGEDILVKMESGKIFVYSVLGFYKGLRS